MATDHLAHLRFAGQLLAEVVIRTTLGRLAKEIREIDVEGQRLLMLRDSTRDRGGNHRGDAAVRLLPAYDPYLLGYRRRDFAVLAPFARRVHPGGGLFRPVVVADGHIMGTWRFLRGQGGTGIAVAPFAALDRSVTPALTLEAADVGRFLEIGGLR